MLIVVACMVLVVAGFFALALTESQSTRESKNRLRLLAVVAWLVIVLAGWLGLAYLALAMPDGLVTAWSWVQDQSLIMQVAMWLFLLPWMITLWVWQMPWAIWLRVVLIAGLALTTLALAITQFSRGKR